MNTHPKIHSATTASAISPDTTVNELLGLQPEAVATLNALGIDTCCGGGCPLRDAAARAGVPLEDVLEALGVSTPRA